MRTATRFAVLALCLVLARPSHAGEYELVPVEENPFATHVDLGDITSDGSGNRQILVRPQELGDIGHEWKFFPPHDQLPNYFPEPTPATPAQSTVHLTSDVPLILVLPQLRHKPSLASISVSHLRNDNEITVDADIHWFGGVTRAIYGPHEYLYQLGYLEPGAYRLRLNLDQSDELSSQTRFATGYVDFVVHPATVPEPSTMLMVLGGLGTLGLCRRYSKSRCATTSDLDRSLSGA
jgi:hypothetical protein